VFLARVEESCIPAYGQPWGFFANSSEFNSSILDALQQRLDNDSIQPSMTSTPSPTSAAELNSPEGKTTMTVSMTTATPLRDSDSSEFIFFIDLVYSY